MIFYNPGGLRREWILFSRYFFSQGNEGGEGEAQYAVGREGREGGGVRQERLDSPHSLVRLMLPWRGEDGTYTCLVFQRVGGRGVLRNGLQLFNMAANNPMFTLLG